MGTIGWRRVVLLGIVVVLGGVVPGLVGGQARETAGVITEIKVGKGRVDVKAPGGDWKTAGPLQAVRAGDEVRVTDNASVVILLSGGRGTIRVETTNSPFVVGPIQADASKIQKAQTLVASSIGFLSTTTKEAPRAVLSTRALSRPPVIITPRNGPVLPDSVVFEWLGNQFSRYTVRVVGPTDVVLERKGIMGARFTYPPDAPALRAGVRYKLQVLALNHPPHEAEFEVVDGTRAAAVGQDLQQLETALGAGVSPNSLAAAKAATLASAGLFHDARLLVTAALARDPEEATLHMLLGNLYLKTGLDSQAADAFEEAAFLLARTTK